MSSTALNSVYAVPLRFTHIANATSHTRERCTKSLASLLYVVQRGADEQSTAVLITRSARDFAQQRISNIRPAPPPPFGGAGLTSDHPRHVRQHLFFLLFSNFTINKEDKFDFFLGGGNIVSRRILGGTI